MAGMERFTQRARRVLSLAHLEAESSRNNEIGTEHVLLGLIGEEGGVAGRVLTELGLTLDRLREVIRRVAKSSSEFNPNRVELSAETQQVLEYAVEEARRLGHHYIGTEHILLGLVRVDSTAMEVLRRLGVTADQIRRQTRRVLNESASSSPAIAKEAAVLEKLKQISAIEKNEERVFRIIQLLPDLSGDNLKLTVGRAYESALAIDEEAIRADAVSRLAPYLPADILVNIIGVAKNIKDPSIEVNLCIAILPFLAQEDKNAALQEALVRAEDILNPIYKSQAYLQLLPYVPDNLRGSVVENSLKNTQRIDDLASRAELLVRLLSYTPQSGRHQVIQNAIEIEQSIQDPASKSRVQSLLSRYLTESEKGQFELENIQLTEKDAANTETPVFQAASLTFSPPVAGYITDCINDEAPDLLNIEQDVANIANVLTFKQVQPPLALGLFGDWGSGKSFFIGKLRKYINQLADHYRHEEEVSRMESMWCSRVAQIEFNAWHFSDSNLWASLVTRIYEGLDRELNKEKETADEIKKKIIEAQIEEAKEKSLKAATQLELATDRVTTAEKNLAEKRKNREGKENELLEMIGNLPDLLDSRLSRQLSDAAASLGVPKAAETFDELESLSGEIQGMAGRTKAVFASILYSPFSLVVMAVFILILPSLLTSAIDRWEGWMTDVGKNVTEVGTYVLFFIGWMKIQVRRGLGLVAQVEQALMTAREIRQQKIEQDAQVKKARDELTVAKAEEQAARANLEVAKTDLQRLQDELQELRPERKLQRLIEARASSGAYAQYLGIISLIRSDFEMMSNILSAMASDKDRDFEKAPPIQRIILYIDDLDRCKPDRVVEVLEAIHLLLFFPLFVVVVAVDPRWLRHSLAEHYPATLDQNGGGVMYDGRGRTSLYSTPQDYLEKIFQIPFALRPVEKGGYQELINDLLKPLPQLDRPTIKILSQPKLDVQEITTHEIEEFSIPGEVPDSIPGLSQQNSFPVDLPAIEQNLDLEVEGFKPIPPRQLEFTDWEQEHIKHFWLMFRTPRTVKRFVNIYRLLRAGLISESEVKTFEGTSDQPGEYQVALLLLAAITAFPNESSRFLYHINTWLDVQELNNKQNTTWKEMLEFLKADKTSQRVRVNPIINNTDKNVSGHQQRLEDREFNESEDFQISDASWNSMLDCLDRITQNDTWKSSFELSTLRTWVLRVVRFSFSVQPT